VSQPELLLKSTPSTRKAVTVLLSHMVEYYFGNAGLSPKVFADRALAARLHKENEFLFFDYKRADLLAIIPNLQYAGLIRAKVISRDLRQDLGKEVGEAWELTPAGEDLLLEADYIPGYIKEAINKRRSEEEKLHPLLCSTCKMRVGQSLACSQCKEWRAANAAPEQAD